ncbi:hypothetical protein NDU88_007456 [Pleurodeles waltl]|uniref:Uncharacterized protein n=1 Tax=Pleurodeles waltl TaxID=8319 RepID=A0AAV7VTW7_PLEWA|nr:hypothetical protein NDU88_007456 [Pleurodeles waltl]
MRREWTGVPYVPGSRPWCSILERQASEHLAVRSAPFPIVRLQNPVSPLEAAPQRTGPTEELPSKQNPVSPQEAALRHPHAPLVGHKLTNEGDEKERACGCRRGEPPGAGLRTAEQRGRTGGCRSG